MTRRRGAAARGDAPASSTPPRPASGAALVFTMKTPRAVRDTQMPCMFHTMRKRSGLVRMTAKRESEPSFWMREKRKLPRRTAQTVTQTETSHLRSVMGVSVDSALNHVHRM